MKNEMRAAVIHAPGDFSVETVPIPTPGHGEVLIEIKSVAICGSDPGIFAGRVRHNGWPPYYPFIAGHEFAGQVAAVGEGVTTLQVGDRVAGEAHCGCGICENCKQGLYNLCLNYGKAGHHHYGHNTPGCYAQYQVYDQKALTPLPDGVTFDQGAMVDTTGIAYNAMRLTGVVPGGWTAIIGPGPMGIAAMLLAKAMGSRTVMVGRGRRLALAGELGADVLVNFEETDDVTAEVRCITGGGAHQVIEAAGNATAYYESIQMARKGGHVALISIPAQDGQQAALKSLIMNQITLHGVRANPNCSRTVLAMMAQGILPVDRMITHCFALEDIHEAFDTFINRKDGAVKVVVHPND
ncbi:MAG: zinc-binding dehydrogenase [Faecousia sp.]